MNTHNRPNGVTITLPDTLHLEASESSLGDVRRKIPLPTGPITLSPDQKKTDSTEAAIMDALHAQDFTVVDSFDLMHTPMMTDRLRSAGSSIQTESTQIQVELSGNEKAVILTAQEGYYTWHLPEDVSDVAALSPQRGAAVSSARRATFRISIEPVRVPSGGEAKRGVIGDFLFERIKTIILKFAADVVTQQGIKFLERHVQKSLVVITPDDPKRWEHIDDLGTISFPTNRPARILLFIHGTFSSTVGSYGALGLIPWGKAFLQSAQGNYDMVIGFDHLTLSEDPQENAIDLLARLRTLDSPHPPLFDVVCYSRGALVYRSLVEQLLPDSEWNAKFDRTIFTGCTNRGTQLAEPDNWYLLIDLYTNLAAGAARAVGMITNTQPATVLLSEIIKSVGALVKYLVTVIISERRVPGLAAMEPDGKFIRTINNTQRGQISPERTNYYAITSVFKAKIIGGEHQPKELPLRLVLALADGLVDKVMKVSNDLVVDTPSMTAIDSAVGKFIKDEFNFPEGPSVYHTNYFTRPEVVEAIARWLHLPSPLSMAGLSNIHRGIPRDMVSGRHWIAPGATVKPDMPAAVSTNILTVNAQDPVLETITATKTLRPDYVVICRAHEDQLLNYAYSADEILKTSISLPDTMLGTALHLHEYDALPTISRGQVDEKLLWNINRAVVLDEDRPVGVIRGLNDLPTSQELGTLVDRNTRSADIGEGGGVTRGYPSTFGDGPKTQSPISTDEETETERAICHFFAGMDNEVAINRVTTVEVIISREQIEGELGPTGAGSPGKSVDTKRKLIVQVTPRAHCEVVGDDRIEVDVPAPNNPLHLYFDIRPTHLGEGAIWVVVRQGQIPIAELILSPQIVQQRQRGNRRMNAEAIAQEPLPLKQPLHQLRITEQFRGEEYFYEYDFQSPELGILDRFKTDYFQIDRQVFVNQLYQEIEGRWLGSGQDKKLFQADLRAYGGSLFDQLIPEGLQRLLWKYRKEIDSIMVISTEPFIPWELLHLKDPDKKQLPIETLFFSQLGLMRWLHGSWPPEKIRMNQIRYVIPNYPDSRYLLPQTIEEKEFFKQKLNGKPVEPQTLSVQELLSEPSLFNLLHFACHGEAEDGNIMHAKLMLEGRIENNSYIPAYLSVTMVEQYASLQAPDGTRPMIVLNACQVGRAGYKLTGLGGFAQAFLRNGAGAFVGALWSVGDSSARTFTEALYTELLNGKNFAQATKAAREAAQKAGDATWLAYAVYGHPHMVWEFRR